MKLKVSDIVISSNIRANAPNKSSVSYKRLKNNIKEVGILTPVTVNKINNEYVLLDGHQRYSIAKDLKLEEVPYFEVDHNGATRAINQLSANIMSVNMDLLDGAIAIQQLVEENELLTFEDIKRLFGKNNDWVEHAMRISNAIPRVMRILKKIRKEDPYFFKVTYYEYPHFHYFLTLNKTVQEQIISEIKDDAVDVDTINWYVSNNSPGEYQTKKIVEFFGKDKIRQYEKEYGFVNEYENSLFSHYAKETYCTEPEFREFMFSKTRMGKYLSKNYADERIANRMSNCYGPGYTHIYTNQLNSTNILKEFEANKIKAWYVDNDSLDVVIAFETKDDKKKANATETTDDDNFKLGYNKLHAWQKQIAEQYYFNEVKPSIMKKYDNGMLIALDWIINETSIPISFRESLDTSHPSTEIDKLEPHIYLENLVLHYLDDYLFGFTYEDLNTLGEMLGIISYKQYVENYYTSMTKSEKLEFLNMFNVKALNIFANKVLKGSPEFKNKKEVIEHVKELKAKEIETFPFTEYLFKTTAAQFLQHINRY